MREFGIKLEDIDTDDFSEREVHDTVVIAGREITLYVPTAAQAALLLWGDGTVENVRNALNVLGYMMPSEDKEFVYRAVLRNALSPDEVLELVREVTDALVADRPTTPPTTSTRQQRTGGRTSTATSRRAGSTRGRSPRPASAT